MMKNISSTIKSACLLTLIFLFLTGCAGIRTIFPDDSPPPTPVEHYPDCYAPIEEFRKTKYIYGEYFFVRFTEEASKGIGSTVETVIGWFGGGGDGAASDFHDIAEEQKKKRLILEGLMADVEKYANRTEQTIDAVRKAQQCYTRSFDRAVADYKAGRISQEDFERQYAEINAGMKAASLILEKGVDDGKEMQQIAIKENTDRKPRQNNQNQENRNQQSPRTPEDDPELQIERLADLTLALESMKEELDMHSRDMAKRRKEL
jgi:hypothetical protein